MEFNDLTEGQKEVDRACRTTNELVALATSEGVELSDDRWRAIADAAFAKHVFECAAFHLAF